MRWRWHTVAGQVDNRFVSGTDRFALAWDLVAKIIFHNRSQGGRGKPLWVHPGCVIQAIPSDPTGDL